MSISSSRGYRPGFVHPSGVVVKAVSRSVSAARRASVNTSASLLEAASALAPSKITASCLPRLSGSAAPASAAVATRRSRKACLCRCARRATSGSSPAPSTAALWKGQPRKGAGELFSGGGEDRQQSLGRGLVAALQRCFSGERLLRLEPAKILLHQCVLGREVHVEGPGRDVRGLHERRHTGGVDATGIEELLRGLQDALPRAAPAAGRPGG
jgi:hypothetical protein